MNQRTLVIQTVKVCSGLCMELFFGALFFLFFCNDFGAPVASNNQFSRVAFSFVQLSGLAGGVDDGIKNGAKYLLKYGFGVFACVRRWVALVIICERVSMGSSFEG